ncbi:MULTISPECIES: DUF2530 domain-containing protein [Prauserella]|uniref:DUF2530 domain-containing protein n=1 Tax=Prauserella TaxID=142577 RepID=UPI001E3DF924|nr:MULTISPECIES: DUF2530 domain-containing protein [Prauserella]
MDEASNSPGVTGQFRPPPDLPKVLVGLWAPVITGTVIWLIAFAAMLIAGVDGDWLWTTLAGAGLGCVGFVIIAWQSAASRRGSRGAQRVL